MKLPREYIGYKFLQLCPYSSLNRDSDKYIGCCPLCREGKSFAKKKRCAYLPEINRINCLNCSNSSTPLEWIMKVGGMTYGDLLKDYRQFCEGNLIDIPEFSSQKKEIKIPDLPYNEINLFDEYQINFYKNDKNIKKALSFLKERKLDVAVNKPDKYFISLSDKIHKNRIIIPFYDDKNKVLNYQSRSLDNGHDVIRYLTKISGVSCLFNFNKIDNEYENIFIFEGPFDSTFIKNGVAIGGIQENSFKIFKGIQEDQIKSYPFHNKIWVLDSQHKDKASYVKSLKLLELGEKVFIWPRKIGSLCKDFNDIAMLGYMDFITPEWVIKNTYTLDVGVSKLKNYNLKF